MRGLRPTEAPQPVYVEVRHPERRDRELDLPVQPPPPRPRDTPAKRLAEQDQVVKRETAPQGEDAEDRQRSVRAQRAPAAPAAPAPVPAVPPPPLPSEPEHPLSPQGEQGVAVPQPAPSLEQLTRLTPTTMAKLESDWRKKLREGVERGDTVWLDTEQDLLISFFRRFKTNIYNVWNYPERARMREEQGKCLLRIVVSRQGTIDEVALLESSGSRELDDEAVRAVRKGQPYGPLPSAYPHEKLNIMAYFNYSLSSSRRYLYGDR
jgi:protein TonB